MSESPRQQHPHHHHRRPHPARRLRQLVLPDGKRAHVARSPEEAARAQRVLSHQSQSQSQSQTQTQAQTQTQTQTSSSSASYSISPSPHPISRSGNGHGDHGGGASSDAGGPVVLLHGSAAHLAALHTSRSHHEGRRAALRERLARGGGGGGGGGDRDGLLDAELDEFERVGRELARLGADLRTLTSAGASKSGGSGGHQHRQAAVALDANFSRFGYSARLRTYDDGDEEEEAGGSGEDAGGGGAGARGEEEREEGYIEGDYSGGRGGGGGGGDGDGGEDLGPRNWDAERGSFRSMKLWERPVVRQYFHKGLIWRASAEAEVNAFELFVDLLYVGIIAINGDHASETPTGQGLLRFAITFIMSWKIWNDVTVYNSWITTEDVVSRVAVLVILTALLGLTTNTLDAFEGETYTQLVAFYLAARLFVGAYYLMLSFLIPMVRGAMFSQTVIAVVPAALWIASVYVAMPRRLALVFVTLALDLSGAGVVVFFFRFSRFFSAGARERIDRAFEFFPAVNIEHKTERTNAFMSLVFGYSVVAILYQNKAAFGVNAFFGKAVLGLIQSYALNWLYFEVDSQNLFMHSIRRSVYSGFAWITLHLPAIMALILQSSAMSKLVLAHDCADADADTLMDTYAAKSEEDIPDGLRWFYCAGLGIALASMGLISMTHIHRETQGVRLTKRQRLASRFAVCAALVCLPLAGARLDSLGLLSTTTGLVAGVLLLELWGTSCPQESLFGRRRRRGGALCSYEARARVRAGRGLRGSGGGGEGLAEDGGGSRARDAKGALTAEDVEKNGEKEAIFVMS